MPDSYYHKVAGNIYRGKIPFDVVEGEILSLQYVPITSTEINEADETPHPFLHPPSAHLYKVRVTSGGKGNERNDHREPTTSDAGALAP